MSNHDRFHGVLRAAGSRLRRRQGIGAASLGALVATVVGLGLVLADRILRPDWPIDVILLGTLAAGPIVGFLLGIFRRIPDEFAAAVQLERHHEMKERLSSALYVERSAPRDCSDELVELVLSDGEEHAARVDVARAIPIAVPRSAKAAVALGAVVALTWWLMPPVDLFGKEEARQELEREADRLEEQDRRLRQRAKELAKIADRHQITEETKKLLADLQKPRALPKAGRPKEAMRRPLAQLEDLKKRTNELSAREGMKGLEEMIRSMQGIDERMETEEGKRAQKAMSQGSPQRASEALKKMAEKLASQAGSMSSQEMEALSRDLQKLAASLGGKFPELSKDLAKALSEMKAGNSKGAASKLGQNADELARLARLMKEKNLLDSVATEIEFTQDELAQLPKEWKSGPPPKICPDCLKGT